jgi:hypothetical protein
MPCIYFILKLVWSHCGSWDLITHWLTLWAIIRGFQALEAWGGSRRKGNTCLHPIPRRRNDLKL